MDVAIVGRVNIDFFATPAQTNLAEASSFVKAVGGFGGNVATACARLGLRSHLLSRVGDDGFGHYAKSFLGSEGVDTGAVSTDPYWPTPVAFIESWPPDDFPILYYRRPTSSDLQLRSSDIDWGVLAETSAVCISGTALSQAPSSETCAEILSLNTPHRILDLDYRPTLWASPDDYRQAMHRAASRATVIIGNEEEIAVSELSEWDGGTLVQKLGPDGARVADRGKVETHRPYPSSVVNGLGAGDAFCAAFVYGLINGRTPLEATRLGVVAGGLVVERLECSEAMPTIDELTRGLEEYRSGS